MANKSKSQTKIPTNNNQEIAKDMTTTYGSDQEAGSEFPYKPSDRAANKKQQNPQS